jgi:enoyl-CoA hydratase/carnithine racemase
MAETKWPSPEEIILYTKDPKTKIATITFNRPEFLNAPTSAARLRYADLLYGANVDDDVGDDFGSGADFPEMMEGADAVRDNDAKFPPDFRLSKSGRAKKG